MTADLSTTASSIQLTLTAFLIGIALGQLVFGPLSDRFGRMTPLVVGSLLCLAASAVTALAPTVEMLTAAQVRPGGDGRGRHGDRPGHHLRSGRRRRRGAGVQPDDARRRHRARSWRPCWAASSSARSAGAASCGWSSASSPRCSSRRRRGQGNPHRRAAGHGPGRPCRIAFGTARVGRSRGPTSVTPSPSPCVRDDDGLHLGVAVRLPGDDRVQEVQYGIAFGVNALGLGR